MQYGKRIAVVPAGERWEDETLRPAFEDLIGAGAIIHGLRGSLSPEAFAAVAVWDQVQNDLPGLLRQCSSGKELIERGFATDVEITALANVSDCIPMLANGAFRQRSF